MSPERVYLPLKHAFWDSWRLPVAAIAASVLLIGALIVRGQKTDAADNTLCQIIVAFVVSGDVALDDPATAAGRLLTVAEKRKGHASNIAFVRELDPVCDTDEMRRTMERRLRRTQ